MRIDAQRLLIICPNWVGDVVMATPAFRSLRAAYPDAKISLLLRPYVRKVLDGAPWFDELIDYDSRRKKSATPGFFATAKRLRGEQFDLAVVLPNSFSSALMAWFGGAKRRLGYVREHRGWLLSDALSPEKERGKIVPVNMVDYYLAFYTYLECDDPSKREELFVSQADEQAARELLAQHGFADGTPLIAINPGAAFGSSKCWTTSGFANVGDELMRSLNAKVIILWGPGEEEIARDIENQMELQPINPRELVPLDVLKALIKRCDLLVTNDTGPRHFAVAFDKPAVVIMGPTDPRYTDVNLERTTVLRLEVECGPCHLKQCPTDHRCMRDITPEMVVNAVKELLGS